MLYYLFRDTEVQYIFVLIVNLLFTMSDLLKHRPEENAAGDEEEYIEDRMCEECAEALVAHDASTKVGLGHRADKEAKDERCRRKTQLMIDVADHTEDDDGLHT